MSNKADILRTMLACALLLSGCSALDKAQHPRTHTLPKPTLQTAIARAVAALREYRDIDDWAGKYELVVRRRPDHWTLDFVDVPATASWGTSVLVYDTGKVEIIPGF